ncbi:MAG: 4Fe-4S binding protein [Deltaproteobacteria bacterium]|nr:4Fe-4S binding protein [Deltaproteobacteria bacterium]
MYKKTLSLRFPKKIVNDPIVVNLVKNFDLTFNILKATVYPRKEGLMVLELSGHRKNYQKGVRYLKDLGIKVTVYPRKEGLMVLELSGHRKNYQKGVRYLKDLGIKVESIGQDISRDEDICFQCGACTAVCPSGALHIKRPEMEVLFDRDICSACELLQCL